MRTCIIHIGLHKTASTSLQRMMCDNRDLLLRSGIYFPEAATESLRFGHHTLAAEMNDQATRLKLAPVYQSLARELEEQGLPSPVLLSSEDFSRSIHSKKFILRLTRWMRRIGYRVETLAYVRPQHTAIHSMYTQRLKMWALHDTFEDFCAAMMESRRYDYDWRFAALLDSPGISAKIHPFNSEIFAEGIHRHFLRSIGMPDELRALVKIPQDRNIAPGPKTIAALLRIGRLLKAKGIAITKQDFDWVGGIIRQMAKSKGWDDERYNALTPEICAAIEARFKDSNERFSQKVFGRPWNDVFARELADLRPVNVFRRDEATAAERNEVDEFTHDAAEAIISVRQSGGLLQAAQ